MHSTFGMGSCNISLRMRDLSICTFSIVSYFFKAIDLFSCSVERCICVTQVKALKRVHQVFRGKDTSIALHDRNAIMTPLLPCTNKLRKVDYRLLRCFTITSPAKAGKYLACRVK